MDMPVWLSTLVGLPAWAKLAILAGIVVLSTLLGNWLARRWRSDDYGPRLGVMFSAVGLAAAICLLLWPPKLGIDLSGGVILVYEIDEEATQRQQAAQAEEAQGPIAPVTAADIVPYVIMRLNPSGLEDVVVRPYGDDQVEVIIPHVEQAQIDRIKDIISQAGYLEFLIVANPFDHDYIIEAAINQPGRGRQVRDEEGRVIGLWADLGVLPDDGPQGEKGDYRMSPLGQTIIRNADTGEIMTDEQGTLLARFLPADPAERDALFERFYAEEGGLQAQREYFEEELGVERIQVLMAADDPYDVRGDHIESVSAGFDESGYPSINFTMTPEGAVLFSGLTGENAPDPQTGRKRRLGIVMDNNLISAPELRSMISRQGQITGRFTDAEVADLVQIIRGGSLPAALTTEPTSESQISPLLGAVTVRQSAWAIAISLVAVLVFMLFYYRFAGAVACAALVTNLLLIVAVMILLKASFTLPGMAGLVLTVGMSVDANILIFERIREELSRGAKVRMALRNGFARATTTIVDANVTTLITAIVLYAIGTDLIRGFAVTLILGIIMSMFTAIYCSRTIFELGERRHWFRDLRMAQWLGDTRINFLSKRRIAMIASAVLIAVGLVGVYFRGINIFDIDMIGGTAVDVLFTEPLTEQQLRERLEKEQFLAAYHEVLREDLGALDPSEDADRIAEIEAELQATDFDMSLLGLPGYLDEEGDPLEYGQAWKVVTSFASVEDLEKAIQRIFAQGDENLLVMRQVSFTEPEPIGDGLAPEETSPIAPKPASEPPPRKPAPSKKPEAEQPESQPSVPAEPKEPAPKDEPAAADEGGAASVPRESQPRPPVAPEEADPSEGARRDLPGPNVLAMAGEGDFLQLAQADAQDEEPNVEEEADAPAPAEPAKKPKKQAPKAPQQAETRAARPVAERSQSTLAFRYRIDDDALKFALAGAAERAGVDLDAELIEVRPLDEQEGKEWLVTLPVAADQAAQALQRLQAQFAETPVFPSASKIGGKVAADMQRTAALALLLSLVGIVVYLWIRFQRVAYGLAAVAAVVHDVLVTLGAVALSFWLADVFGFLLIENFKISLPVVAAFLTIIGYSLNDTIVIFDRVREIKGKSPRVTTEMINTSINQTLSRTLLTSGTTLIVVLILYAIGGPGVHGFAFAMLVGVVAGTYSTIYIASPVLLWLTESAARAREAQQRPAEQEIAKTAARPHA